MFDPGEREAQAVALLDQWPWELGGVLIGGYAVAAYGAPRYSDDLDLVIPVAALEETIRWLTEDMAFRPLHVPDDLIQNYAGKVGRLTNESVVVDLLPGAVRDREAQVDIPERWIAQAPIKARLVLMETSTRSPVPVVRPEAFWALKLQAGRHRDLGDLLSIGGYQTDFAQVRSFFETLMCNSLGDKLAQVWQSLGDDKMYTDVLSHRQLGSPKLPRNRNAWHALRSNVKACLPRGVAGPVSAGHT